MAKDRDDPHAAELALMRAARRPPSREVMRLRFKKLSEGDEDKGLELLAQAIRRMLRER